MSARLARNTCLALSILVAPAAAQEAAARNPWMDDAFDVRALVGLSDADMVATAYVDQKLGKPVGPDTMTVLAFDGKREPSAKSTLPVSNSVAGPPAGLAITPDGRYAIVAETVGPKPAADRDVGLQGLLPGRKLSVVDIVDARHPRIVQELQGPNHADSVSVSADGTFVAVAVSPEGDGTTTPLVLYRFRDGRLEDASTLPIPNWMDGDHLIDATFAPQGRRIALLNADRQQASVFDIAVEGKGFSLKKWGEPVKVEPRPFLVQFSPDGSFIFVNCVNDAPVRRPPNGYPRGSVSAYKLDAERDASGGPIHLMTSLTQAGRGSEGMAVSPDGRFIVTINREGSAFPAGDPRRTPYASLSLFRFEPHAGQLHRVGDFAFDGVLPEGAAFDRSSRRLAVANFQKLDEPTGGGAIDFWRLSVDPQDPERIALVRTENSIPVQRGMQIIFSVP